jgi:UDP-N-acetylmuramoylalanine--D-glutamate ligase
VLGGNIGGSLLDRLPLTGVRVIVLELSSAMLHWIGALTTWAPAISVCTNLSPNHLDWHGTLDHYASSKQRLLTHQHPHDDAILGPTLAHWASLTSARASIVQGPLQHALAIPGAHNRLNAAVAHRACAAVLTRLGMPVDSDAITAALAAFPGLEHRLALCHTSRDGRKFYNDSKCTTVAACQQAIASLAEDAAGRTDHLHLIVGGDAKGQDITPIARLAPTLAGMYAIGRDGALFASRQPTVQTCDTLDNAVRTAVARMKPGHVLLLSPACASWDQFPNYEYRGRQFTQACQTAAP